VEPRKEKGGEGKSNRPGVRKNCSFGKNAKPKGNKKVFLYTWVKGKGKKELAADKGERKKGS